MQFLMIISHDDKFSPTETLINRIQRWAVDTEKKGIRKYGNPLQPASAAVTVRVRKGKTKTSQGPFSTSVEQMCAYELIECDSVQEAVAVAEQHPMAEVATIEVRPVWAELAD